MSVTRLRLLPASVVALGAALGVSVLLLGQTGGTTSKAGAAAPKSRGCGRSRPTTMSRAIGTIPGHARSEEEIWTHA